MTKQRLIWIALVSLLVLSYVEPALAQKTTQVASKSEVMTMVIFSAIGMVLLNYFRIP